MALDELADAFNQDGVQRPPQALLCSRGAHRRAGLRRASGRRGAGRPAGTPFSLVGHPGPERAALVRLLQDVDVKDELTDLALEALDLLVFGRLFVLGACSERAFSPAEKNCSGQRSISAIVRPCLRAASAAEVSPLTMLITTAALRFAVGALHLFGNVGHERHLLGAHHGRVLRVASRIRGAEYGVSPGNAGRFIRWQPFASFGELNSSS